MDWFTENLRALLGREKGNRNKVADLLGVARTTINAYLRKAPPPPSPSLATAERLLVCLGGDISRALPDYQPDRSPVTVTVVGQVSAGSAIVSEENAEQVDAIELNWTESHAWARTTGPVVYLRVRGDSMEPAYPDRCLIACRRPIPGLSIPRAWPVILQDASNHEQTFKLYYEIPGRSGRPVVLGVPVNDRHDPVPFGRGALINYLVLGKLQPFKGQLPERGMLLREAG